MQIDRYHIQSPVEVITLQLGIPQDYKQQCIEEIYRLGDSMKGGTNVKATMTSFLIWEQSKVFNILLDNIKKIASSLVQIPIGTHDYILDSAWGAIYKKGNYTIPHHHLPWANAFVYYLQSSGNTPLLFDDSNFKINPIDDTLVIFPAYLTHSVPLHNEEDDRVCIAGNFAYAPIKSKISPNSEWNTSTQPSI